MVEQSRAQDLCVYLIRRVIVPADDVARCLREWERLRLTGDRVPFYEVLDSQGAFKIWQLSDMLVERSLLMVLCPRCGRTLISEEVAQVTCGTCEEACRVIDPAQDLHGTWSVISSELPPMAPVEQPQPLQIDDLVGRYRLERLLGQGASGSVYLAHDPNLDRKVALKVLRSGDRETPRWIRFEQEARLIAQLDHPNVVRVMLLETEAEPPYLVMEYVEGQSFEDLLSRPYKRDLALRILTQVAGGVGMLHDKGIVHRDLKPANVLLDTANNPKVTDFGLAKEIDGTSALTMAGQSLGTPHYMAPEQISGELDQIGPATDVFALGVTLYRVLTGSLPYEAASVIELLGKVLMEPFPSPRETDHWVTPALDQVCLKATRLAPQDRYASAEEFREALEYALDPPLASARRQRPSSVRERRVSGSRQSRVRRPESKIGLRRARAPDAPWALIVPAIGLVLLAIFLASKALQSPTSSPPERSRAVRPAPKPTPSPAPAQPSAVRMALDQLLVRVRQASAPFPLLDLSAELASFAKRHAGSAEAQEARAESSALELKATRLAREKWGPALRKAEGQADPYLALQQLGKLPAAVARFKGFEQLAALQEQLRRRLETRFQLVRTQALTALTKKRKLKEAAHALERLLDSCTGERRVQVLSLIERLKKLRAELAKPVVAQDPEPYFRSEILPLWHKRDYAGARRHLEQIKPQRRWRAAAEAIEQELERTAQLSRLFVGLSKTLAAQKGKTWLWRGLKVTIEQIKNDQLMLTHPQSGTLVRHWLPLRRMRASELAYWYAKQVRPDNGVDNWCLAVFWYAESDHEKAWSCLTEAMTQGKSDGVLMERVAWAAFVQLEKRVEAVTPAIAHALVKRYRTRFGQTRTANAQRKALDQLQSRFPAPRQKPKPKPKPKARLAPELSDANVRKLRGGMYKVEYRFNANRKPKDFNFQASRIAMSSGTEGLILQGRGDKSFSWKPKIHGPFWLRIKIKPERSPGPISLYLTSPSQPKSGYRILIQRQVSGRWGVGLYRQPNTLIGRIYVLTRLPHAGETEIVLKRQQSVFELTFDKQSYRLGKDETYDDLQLRVTVGQPGQLTLGSFEYQGGLGR